MHVLFAIMSTAASAAACPAPAPVTLAQIKQAAGRTPKASDTILTGVDRPADGSPQAMVFVRRTKEWAGYSLTDNQEIVANYRTPQGRTVIFGFHTAEGPGDSFAGLVFDGQGRLIACPILMFPKTLNRDEQTGERNWNSEFLSLDSLSVDKKEQGRLLASGSIDVGGKERTVRYIYASRDGGRTWGAPRANGGHKPR